MGRALVAALQRGGHDVSIASQFRSYDSGDARRQARLREQGHKIAHRMLRRFERRDPPPDAWFTYHLYHKAPDWIGPTVARRLRIPYVVAEASYAPKQAGGRFDLGHRAVAEALAQATLVLQPNPADTECVLPLLAAPERLKPLPPFLETALFRMPNRHESRRAIVERLGADGDKPWLLTVAMMRADQKLLSYRILADALSRLPGPAWELMVVGAGPAAGEVRATLQPLGARVRWAGALAPEELRSFYRAADIYVWPAIKEAYGMTLLEAQAAGLPVVAGRSGGVSSIVADDETGMLTSEGDASAIADAVATLLRHPDRRRAMGQAAEARAAREHDIQSASVFLGTELAKLTRPG